MGNAVKKALLKACVDPLENIVKICQCKDSNANKVKAINYYCKTVLSSVKEAVEKELK